MRFPTPRLTRSAAALLVLGSAAAAQDWVQPSPATVPIGRNAQGMAFDLNRQQVVMFGGAKDGSATGGLQDTWTWNGTDWTQHSPTNVPPTRTHPGMSYDFARGVVVMFGGRFHGGPAGPMDVRNDLWEWNGTDWTQIMATNPPPARYSGTMAYDVARGVHVLFSGVSGSNVSFDDTWEYNPATTAWTQRMPTTSPGGRVYAGMAYDQARSRIVVYGGADDTFTIMPSVFWEWDGTSWTSVSPATNPGPTQGHIMFYDFNRKRVVIQGGQTTGRAYRIGTWEYDGVHTYHFNAEANPAPGSWLGNGTHDWVRNRAVIFGGYSGGNNRSSATWERDGNLPGFAVFGAGCGATSAPFVVARSLPGLGTTFTLNVNNLPPAAVTSVLFGVSNTTWSGVPLPLSLGVIGAPSCTLYTSIDIVTSASGSGGTATWSVPIPNDPALSGFTFYNQALASTGGPLSLSDCGAATVR